MNENVLIQNETTFSDENVNTINLLNSKNSNKLNKNNKNSNKKSEQSMKIFNSGLNAKRIEISNISQTEEAINILDKILKKDEVNKTVKSIKSNLSDKISEFKDKYSSTLEELKELDEREFKETQDINENSYIENDEDNEYKYNINESAFVDTDNEIKADELGAKSYEKFGLNERYTPAYLCSNNKITHKLLPYKYKDDSKYKLRLINYLKKDLTNKFKTDSCSYAKMIKSHKISYKNKLFLKKNRSHKLSDIIKNTSNYLTMGLKNDRNNFKSFEVEDERNCKIPFNLYDDTEIGIEAKWQIQLKMTEMDDDIDSDEDQLKAALRHINKDNKDTIFKIKDNIIKTRNLHRFNEYVKIQPKIILLNGKCFS